MKKKMMVVWLEACHHVSADHNCRVSVDSLCQDVMGSNSIKASLSAGEGEPMKTLPLVERLIPFPPRLRCSCGNCAVMHEYKSYLSL